MTLAEKERKQSRELNYQLDEVKKIKASGWKEQLPGVFMPGLPSRESLKPGYYRVSLSLQQEAVFKSLPEPTTDELIEIPGSQNSKIIDDIVDFVEKKDVYKRLKVVHKRGLLFEGPPGSGKTAQAQLIARYMIEHHDAIVILAANIDALTDCLAALREIEPNRLIVVLLEEFDSMIRSYLPEILSLLDGENQVNNVVYIATTNHVDKLPASLTNRPSRFDEVITVGMPNAEVRHAYISLLAKRGQLFSWDIPLLVTDTEGFSLSHLKELMISLSLGKHYGKTLERLKKMLGQNLNDGDGSEE